MKTYTSASWSQSFTTRTRSTAIEEAITFLKTKTNTPDVKGKTFTWRAHDDSGFTLAVSAAGEVSVQKRYNPASTV